MSVWRVTEVTGVAYRLSKDREDREGCDANCNEIVRAVLDVAGEWLETEDGLFLPMLDPVTQAPMLVQVEGPADWENPGHAAQYADEADSKLLCFCQRVYDPRRKMIECSHGSACLGHVWYHPSCLLKNGCSKATVNRVKLLIKEDDEMEVWLCPSCLDPRAAPPNAAPARPPSPAQSDAPAINAAPSQAPPAPLQAPAPPPQPAAHNVPAAPPDENAQVWSQEFRQLIRSNEQLTMRPLDEISLVAFPRLKKTLNDDPDRNRKLGVIARLLARFFRDLNIRFRKYWPWLEALSMCDPNPVNRPKNKAKVEEYVTRLLTRFPWSTSLRDEYGDADTVQLSASKFFAMTSWDTHYSKPDDQPLGLYYGNMLDSEYGPFAYLNLHCLRVLLVSAAPESHFRTMNQRLTANNSSLAIRCVETAIAMRTALPSVDTDFALLMQRLKQFRKEKHAPNALFKEKIRRSSDVMVHMVQSTLRTGA